MSNTGIPKEALPLMARLTKWQSTMLLALWSLKGESNTVCPTRAELERRTGISIRHISSTTRQLVRLGWIAKYGKGGRHKAARYTLLEPWKRRQAPQDGAQRAFDLSPPDAAPVPPTPAPVPQRRPQESHAAMRAAALGEAVALLARVFCIDMAQQLGVAPEEVLRAQGRLARRMEGGNG